MSRPAYSAGIGLRPQSIIITTHQLAALAAFAAGAIKFTMPQSGTIIGITMNVAEKGGTHGTSTVDVKAGDDSVLGSVIDVAGATAGTPVLVEGDDLADAAVDIAKDTEMSVVLAVSGGSSPTARGLTVQIDYIPTGD
jgi:hypothetical protein